MFRMMVSSAIAVIAISCAAPATQIAETDRPAASTPPSSLPLARFMREEVNVPFSFMMLESPIAVRGRRVHKAATVLREAARDLVEWSDPPVESDEAREVFFAYAQNLEYHVARLEDAAARHEDEQSASSVEEIRQTCNHCHRFFRPSSYLSPDVAYDWYELELGGVP